MQENVIKRESCFKNKNYLLLFQGHLTSNIAATLYTFALNNYILEITNNNAIIQGIYLFMCGIVFVLTSFIGGVLADRWSKVKIIYGTDAIKGLLILFSFIPLSIGINNDNSTLILVIIFIIGFVNNFLAAIFNPAASAIIPEILENDQIEEANSISTSCSSLLSILSAILGGLLYSLLGIKFLFIIIGVCYIISAITELFIKTNGNVKTDEITLKLIFSDFKEAFKYLFNLKSILYLIFGILFINFFISPVTSNALPYIVETDITNNDYMFKEVIDPIMWKTIFTVAFGLGSIGASLIIGMNKKTGNYAKRIKRSLVLIAISMILCTLVYVIFINLNMNLYLIMSTLVFILMGALIVTVNIPISVAIQLKVEKEMLAKVYSLINICTQGLVPLACLLGGLIIGICGTGVLLISCALGFTIIAILIYASKEINKL